MGRIIGLDYGRARIGIAYSDERRLIASPLQAILCRKNRQETLKLLKESLLPIGSFDAVIVGLPLLLDGSRGEMASEAEQFGNAVAEFLQVPCMFWDERLTSAQADRMLKEAGLSRKQRAGVSDSLSAVLILQNYLEYSDNKKHLK